MLTKSLKNVKAPAVKTHESVFNLNHLKKALNAEFAEDAERR